MKTIISLVLGLSMLLPHGACNENAENWYLKRGKEGEAPQFPPSAEYIVEQNGFYMDNDAYANGEKVIYLTFDAGYENGNIAKILDILKEKRVTGAFFILSNLIKKNPDIVRRMADEGHLVCNHTKNHKDMTTLTDEEMTANLQVLYDQYKELTGTEMAKYFRFPEGRYNKEKVALCNTIGYRCVFWSAAYADWDNQKQMEPQKALDLLLSRMHNGAVILLHPTSSTNAEILPQLIDKLREQGYRFGTLDELCVAR